ncbi:acyltransferase [Roseovarius gahaiensis]|uniref:Acyltransferase n=1 Tax=Roseovarius gahaiensis TaxID=2716691 RepID=A0A967EGQ5_9RHOB|nr:acyltransferase family protein [Roseovarius gahaiensis]NHQ75271.1 acyltransferase [Roseovarius gahaiensis]
MKYRREIDGLRAVALVPVVLFHAGLSLFSGGYVGVDVFFVISGYLITTIIIAERDEGRFSILRFYERRARRILPALFLVMGLCVPLAWIWMPPDAFNDFLRSTAFAALFISNVHFWENVGYFAIDAELRPLLHTWSLAVEEQYYVFFPLLLALLGVFRRAKHIIVIGLLAAGSLALSEWGWRNYPDQNFFFTFSRIWELFAGSICAFIVFKRPVAANGPAAALGLGMILYSVFIYDGSVPFPSAYALLPVVGTALILLFAQQGTIVARLLSMKLPVAIGLVSYSAYLWHQPLFAFARLRSLHEPALWIMLLLAVLSFGLAVLSWRYVEQPFRAGPRKWLPGRPALFGASLAGIAAFVAFGLGGMQLGWADARLAGRMTPFYQQIMDSTAGSALSGECLSPTDGDETATKFCTVFNGDPGGETLAVFGDSHAQAILPAFEQYSNDTGARVVKAITAGCPPLIGAYVLNGNFPLGTCHNLGQAQARYVAENDISTVVLVSRWSLYTKGTYGREGDAFLLNDQPARQTGGRAAARAVFSKTLRDTAAFYKAQGVRLIILEQVPQMLVKPEDVVHEAMMLRRTPDAAQDQFGRDGIDVAVHDDLQSFARREFEKLDGVEVASVAEAFRDGDRYRWFINGRSAYTDLDHVSLYGARLLQPLMARILSGK